MSPSDAENLNQAVSLAQAGRKAEAHARLIQLVRTSPDDSNVLLWLAFTASDLKLARNALNRVAQIDPANLSLAGAKSWLAQQEAEQARVATPPAPVPTSSPTSIPAQNYGGGYQSSQQFAQPASYASPSQPSYNGYNPANSASVPIPPSKADIYDDQPRKTNPTMLIGAVAVIAVLIIGLVIVVAIATGVFNPDTIAAQGLPVYSSATRIELSGDDRDKTLQSADQVIGSKGGKNFKFEMYSFKRGEKDKVVSFYDSELKKQGWRTLQFNTVVITGGGTINGYANNDNNKAVFVLTTPVSFGITNNSELPSLNGKLKAGDSLLLVYSVELK